MKKQLAIVAFLAGAGAAAVNGAAQANADTLPPVDNELAAVTPANNVRDRILEIAHNEFNKQNPGTFYSEGVRQAWCANFVSWVMRQAGDPLTNVTNGSWRVPGVYTLKDTFAASNKLEPVGYKPAPGDVVLYGGSGHTNIVVGVDGDNITTIGGNESNRIGQRTISRFSGNIMGFGRITDTAPAPLPAPEPAPAPEFVAPPAPEAAPPVDPFLPPPPPPAPEFVAPPAPEFVAPPAPPMDPFLPPPPPAPEFVAPVADPFLPPPPAEVPPPAPEFVAPPMDPFLPPPPPPAPEFVAPEFVAPPADPFLPPPAPEFIPPAPEVAPAVFDAPPPPPLDESIPLSAPAEGIPHLSGAAPGPAM